MDETESPKVLYQGPVRVPLGLIVMCGFCIVFLGVAAFFPLLLLAAGPVALIGFSAFLYYWAAAARTRLVITIEGIKIESGLLIRKTEVIDFFRVQDIALSSVLGRETLTIQGTDVRTPQVELCFHGAAKLFDEIRTAVRNARRNVMPVQQV